MAAEFNPVGWFEIPVVDMGRAKKFYESVLELELKEHEMGDSLMAWFPPQKEVPGTTGGLVKSPRARPSEDGVLIYFTAPDLVAYVERARNNGGEVIQEKTDIGEFGFFALVRDTEGNRIGLHSMQG